MKLALPGVDLGYSLQLDAEEADDNKTNISDPQLGQCSIGWCGDSAVKLTGVLPDISDLQLDVCILPLRTLLHKD